jgi:hypothetical protein
MRRIEFGENALCFSNLRGGERRIFVQTQTRMGVDMKLILKILFGAIFLVMLWINVKAALAMNILASFPLFGANPWAVATLYDACCGFLTFYVWVAYKERTPWTRVAWFVLVMGLGNLAMSVYVLKELMQLKRDEPAWTMLQRRAA